MAVRAKFFVQRVTKHAHYLSGNWATPAPAGEVVMAPVTRGEHNKEWASATPGGQITLTVHGDAFTWFEQRLGQELDIVFSEAAAGD